MKYNNKIILAAHRGDRKRYPENTMPAFESAIQHGVDMIETDIHMTSDGELIIMHDRSTLRTTGQEGFTNEMTYSQIRQLDAGGWFSEAFRDTKVPSVQDLWNLWIIKVLEGLPNLLRVFREGLPVFYSINCTPKTVQNLRVNPLYWTSLWGKSQKLYKP